MFAKLHSRRSPNSFLGLTTCPEQTRGISHSLSPLLFPTDHRPLTTARYCFKSFSCNTYGSPRKCCKQKTYSKTKPFRCNTYKKQGGTSFKPNIFLSPSASRRSDLQTSGCSSVSQNHPLYFLHLTDSPTQRTLLNSFGINPLCTLFIATEGVPPRNSRLGLEMEHPTRSELPTANCRLSTIQERGEMGTGARGAPVPEVGL